MDPIDFVQTKVFSNEWDRLGLKDEDLRLLEMAIMTNPQGCPVISGTGGLRKIRFAPRSWRKGKRGALRVCFVHFQEYQVVLLVVVYAKGERDNISPAGKRTIKKEIEKQRLLFAQRRENQ